jgi:hypothetical protein
MIVFICYACPNTDSLHPQSLRHAPTMLYDLRANPTYTTSTSRNPQAFFASKPCSVLPRDLLFPEEEDEKMTF